MNEEQLLYCLIAFILGWLVSRYMGNGCSVGGVDPLKAMCTVGGSTSLCHQICDSNFGYYNLNVGIPGDDGGGWRCCLSNSPSAPEPCRDII